MTNGMGGDQITILDDSTLFNVCGRDAGVQAWVLDSEGNPLVSGAFSGISGNSSPDPNCPTVDQATWFRLGTCQATLSDGDVPGGTNVLVVPPGTPSDTYPSSSDRWATLYLGPPNQSQPVPADWCANLSLVATSCGVLYWVAGDQTFLAMPCGPITYLAGAGIPMNLPPE